MFDALLAVAYALKNLYNDGFSLLSPAFGQLRLNKKHVPYPQGDLFLEYISAVGVLRRKWWKCGALQIA